MKHYGNAIGGLRSVRSLFTGESNALLIRFPSQTDSPSALLSFHSDSLSLVFPDTVFRDTVVWTHWMQPKFLFFFFNFSSFLTWNFTLHVLTFTFFVQLSKLAIMLQTIGVSINLNSQWTNGKYWYFCYQSPTFTFNFSHHIFLFLSSNFWLFNLQQTIGVYELADDWITVCLFFITNLMFWL